METIRNINDGYDSIDIFKIGDLYGIKYQNNTSIDRVYNKIYKSNIYFAIICYIFFHGTTTLDDLFDALYVSKSTTYRSILKVNEVLTKKYGFSSDTYLYQFTGDELHIRLFMQRFFIESSPILTWPFQDYNWKFYEDFLLVLVSYTPYKLDIYSLHQSSISVIVNEIRYKHGQKHDLPISKLQTSPNKAQDSYYFDIGELNENFYLDMNEEYIEQILGLYIEQEFKYDYSEIEALRDRNAHIHKILAYLEETLDSLISRFNIPLTNREVLLLELYNIVLIENQANTPPFILRDLFWEHNRKIPNYYPAFYDAVFEGMDVTAS